MRLGARTTKELSRKIRLGGYVAYGFRDEEVKGGGSVELMFDRRLMRKLTVSGSHDVVRLGAGQNALAGNNIIGSIFSRRGRNRLSMVDRLDAQYQHEWVHGIENQVGTRFQRIFGNKYVPLIRPDGTMIGSIADAEIQLGMRISHKEKIYRTTFSRHFIESDYPVVSFSVTPGMTKWLMGAY